MPIKPEFYVNLKGKQYALYAGVLDCATNNGLRSLTTELIQIPADENGHMAVVKARVEMEDGRVFEDYGDCSPQNTSAMIATAAIRMASTRAKGRALRDAINLGETLREELPDTEFEESDRPRQPAPTRAQGTSAPSSSNGGGTAACEECGTILTTGQAKLSQQKYQKNLCPSHQRAGAER